MVPGDSELHKHGTKKYEVDSPGNITCADVDFRHPMRTSPDTSILIEGGYLKYARFRLRLASFPEPEAIIREKTVIIRVTKAIFTSGNERQ